MIDWTKLKTQEQKTLEAQTALVKQLESAVDQHIDSICKTKGYDNANSISKYMARPSSAWYAECIALGDWIDACWLHCHSVLNDVSSGNRNVPTVEELVAELPVFENS